MQAGAALERAVDLLERVERRPLRSLTVLTYHRVDEPGARPELDPALISATPEEFERHVAWLAAKASPISLGELLKVRRGEGALPPRAVLLTFDDAYRDFEWHAWPVLERRGVPATLFVPTAFPGDTTRSFWWDRLHAALVCTTRREALPTPVGRLALGTRHDRERAHRRLSAWIQERPHADAMAAVDELCGTLGEPPCPPRSLLSWPELRRLCARGVTVAPHSRTHPRLDRLSLQRAREEMAGSRDDLTRELGAPPVPAFAFPGGGHRPELSALAAEEGFELAFTTERGPNNPARLDWLALGRTNVGRRTTLPVLRAQLLSWPSQTLKLVAGSRN